MLIKKLRHRILRYLFLKVREYSCFKVLSSCLSFMTELTLRFVITLSKFSASEKNNSLGFGHLFHRVQNAVFLELDLPHFPEAALSDNIQEIEVVFGQGYRKP